MTSPTGARAASPTIGQAVGQAEASLTRLLTGILAERGTSRETYLAVQRLTSLGGQAARDDYERDLSEWLELAAADAVRLAGQLTAAGLTENEGGVTRLTRPAARCERRSWPSPRRSPARCWPPSTAPTSRPPSAPWTRSPGWPGGSRPAAGARRKTRDHCEPARHRRGPARHRGRRPDHHDRGARRVPPRPDPAGRRGQHREPVRPGAAPVGRSRLGPAQAPAAPAPHRRGRDHLAGPAPSPGPQPGRPIGPRRYGGRARAHRPPARRGRRAVRRAATGWPTSSTP